MRQDTSRQEIDMKVEELIGSRVWIKTDQFRSVPGKITSTSNAINLDDIKSSVCQSTFRVEMPSGEVIEILGSKIAKIENAGHRAQTSVLAEIVDGLILG
jgi:hypothetical protein